jgi:hypothetical protein
MPEVAKHMTCKSEQLCFGTIVAQKVSNNLNRLLRCLLLAAALVTQGTSAIAQTAETQGPCSPIVNGTQGNVTVTFNGGCTIGITPEQLKEIVDTVQAGRSLPAGLLDRYELLSREFGITEAALTNFFRILGENRVAVENLDAKLREIAAKHLALVRNAAPSTDDTPTVQTTKKEAIDAIAAGDYRLAEKLLNDSFEAELSAARKAQANS